MAKIFHRFTYGSHDPVPPTWCDRCRAGGVWRVKAGAPELRGNGKNHWKPHEENGCTYESEHLIIINPALWSTPTKLQETFFHEVFHAINHCEKSRRTKNWAFPHEVMFRLARALAKWMAENNYELIQKKPAKVVAEDEQV